MSRYMVGNLTTTAGSTTLPCISLYNIASFAAVLREVGLTNTTATETANKLAYLTTAATQGTTLVESKYRDSSLASSSQGFNAHTAGTPVGSDAGYRAMLGAAKGAGVIWTFGAEGMSAPVGTANGIGVVVESGTGQILQAYLVWDE